MIRSVPRQFVLSHEATAIVVAADGTRMAAAAAGLGRVVVYDVRVGRVLFRFGVTATALGFHPDGVRLVSAWSEQRRTAASRPGTEVPSSAPTSSPASDIPSTDSNRDPTRDSSRDGVRESSRDGVRESSRDPSRDSSRDSARISEDEARRSVRVWDTTTGRCLSPEPWFGEAPIAVSPDGRWIAAAADRVTTAVLLMRFSDGGLERLLELPGPPNAIPLRSLSFSSDGKWLVAATGASPVVSWSTEDFSLRKSQGVRDDDTALAYARQSPLVAAADSECRVRLFAPGCAEENVVMLSVRHGRRLLRGIDALSFSPDDALVVARGRTGATQIFSRTLGRPLWTASPGPMAFMPDGKTIAAWWCGAIWLRGAESGDMVVDGDDLPAADSTQDAPSSKPKSRTVTLRSGEPDAPGMATVRIAAPIAPVISDDTDSIAAEAAAALIARLSTGWAESTYRQPAALTARDPDGLGVRLPLRAGFAYVQIRPRRNASRILVQVYADEPDIEPPPSSSLVRLSRWIRDRLGAEARRQAAADREWVAELAPNAAEGDVRIERAPGSLTIVLERPLLPSVDDIEALVHKAEQKLAS